MTTIEEQLEKLLKRIEIQLADQKSNDESVKEHVSWLYAKNMNPRTIVKHIYSLMKFFDAIGDKDAKTLSKQEMERAITKINGLELSEETKRDVATIVKQFYKHMLGDDIYYPPQVAWIRTSGRKTNKTLPEILSEAEVLKMIKVTNNVRDKCIIALIYDSGVRIGELLNLKVKDVDLRTEPAHIIVDGKTGMRRIPIMISAPYVARYLDSIDSKPNDPLFKAIGTWSNLDVAVDRGAVAKVLRIAGLKAGINKRIYPHIFRHSRASYYANRLTEQQLKVFFGWTGDSGMASTYVHLSGRDIDNAILQANGKKPVEVEAAGPTEKVCPRCRYAANGIDFVHCQRCGAPLDESLLIKSEEVSENLKETMLEAIKDPKVMKALKSYFKSKDKGK